MGPDGAGSDCWDPAKLDWVSSVAHCLQPGLNGRLACQQMLRWGISVSLLLYKSPFARDKGMKKNTGMSKVCSEETRTGELDWYHKTCALIFKTDTWHCHFFFLDQWACQHRVVLGRDLIRNGRVYMSLQLAKNYSATSRKEAPLMVSHSTHFFFLFGLYFSFQSPVERPCIVDYTRKYCGM